MAPVRRPEWGSGWDRPSSCARTGVAALAATLALALASASSAPGSPPARAAAAAPYGAHDAGGLRDVLPAGEATPASPSSHRSRRRRLSAHWTDQQAPTTTSSRGAEGLTNTTIPDYFKDATLAARPGDVESTTTPSPV